MRRLLFCSAVLLASASVIGGATAAETGFTIANSTPRFVSAAQKVADVDAAQVIDVTLWLKPHNRSALDSLVSRLYDRKSPLYHRFLSRDAMGRLIAASDDEARSVTEFAVSHNLTVVRKDKLNLSVRVRGTADALEKAFGVKLAYVTFKGRTYRTNLSDPTIADAAGAHVMAVEGLDDVKFEHQHVTQSDILHNPAKAAAARVASASPRAYSNQCFGPSATQVYTSGGLDPIGTFTGAIYAPAPQGCGYTPGEIQTAYGLQALYANGLNGAGQTIVILDWSGEETITSDANAFSKRYGLPALTSSNFAIIDYPGPSGLESPDVEINLDVEWAHAIAPGANILLLVPETASFEDVNGGLLYEVENDFGNISSNSYGSEELYTPISELQIENFILEVGAGEGISFNFASGDGGDYTDDIDGIPPSVIAPADSPYAVAVGGVSLALSSSNTILWQGGWGTNATLISEPGYVPDPSVNFGFEYGSGGGSSGYFAKPSFQSKLGGIYRRLPDIAGLADPFTGAIIAITEPGYGLTYQVYGGTSLATPIFSGLWAIADQAAGGNLGQASPLLYAAPSGTITDIVPVSSTTNVKGVVVNGSSKTFETADFLAEPLEGALPFISGIWNYPFEQGLAYVITFETDSHLRTHAGWDNVTGLGVPVPGALISYLQSTAP